MSGRNKEGKAAVGVCVVAVLIIIYAFTLEQRRMIGDEAGHDPGSRALPLTAGVVMLAAGLYEGLKSHRKLSKSETLPSRVSSASFRWLFWFTLFSSSLYLILIEFVGFILLTTGFLYILFWIYTAAYEPILPSIHHSKRGKGETGQGVTFLRILRSAGGGFSISLGFSVVLYTAGRLVSRELFYWGRSAGISLLSSRTVTVLSFLAMVSILFGIGLIVARRKAKEGRLKSRTLYSLFLSVGTTFFLYIVFRMTFRVNLPQGILYW